MSFVLVLAYVRYVSFDVTPGAIIENSVKLARLPAELRRVLRLNGVEPISSSGPVLIGANALAAISFSLMQTLSNSHRETRALLSTSASTSRPHCPCSSPSQSPPKPRAAGRSSHKKTTPRKQPSVSSSSSSSALGPEPELDFVFPLLSLNALGSESAAGSAAQHSKPVVRFVFDASSFQLPRPSDREPEQPSDSAPKLLFGWTRRRQLATASSPSCSPHEQHVGTAIATPNFDESALLDISRYRAVVEYDDSSHSVPAPSTAHSQNQHQMQTQNATRTTTNCQSREAELAALFLERLRGVLAGESLVEVLQLLASFGQSSTPEAHPEPLPEPANDSCGSSGAERSTRGAQAADTQTHAARLVERFVHLLRGSLGAGGARAGDDGNSAIRMRIRSELLLAEFAAFLSTEQARASGMLERHRFVHQLRALAASIEASLVEQLQQQRASRVQLISGNCDGSDQQQKQQQEQELSQCSSSPVSPSSGTGPGESSSLDDDHWTRDEDSALLECYLQHEGREVDSQLVVQLSAQLVGRSSAQIRSRLSFLIAQLNQME